MPISEQLYLRALRMLNDGLPHAPAAMAWARAAAGYAQEREIPREIPCKDSGAGFTLRELSLGAAEVVSL